MTSILDRPRFPAGPIHGPSEVRGALEPYATDETLALYDQQVEQASKDVIEQDSGEPLAKVLNHWWDVAQVASGAIQPERRGAGRQEFIEAWEAAHPGEKLDVA